MNTFAVSVVIFVVVAIVTCSGRTPLECYRGKTGDTSVESCIGSCVTVTNYRNLVPEVGVFCSTIHFPSVCFEDAKLWKACFCNEDLCNMAIPSSKTESLLWSNLLQSGNVKEQQVDVATNHKNDYI